MKSHLVPGTGERASGAGRASPTDQATREGRGRRNEATNRLATAEAASEPARCFTAECPDLDQPVSPRGTNLGTGGRDLRWRKGENGTDS
jgi:hypothetical protein